MTINRFMATLKGATGPVCDTPVAAAQAFAERNPKARAYTLTVRPVTELAGTDCVTIDYRGALYEYVVRKGVVNVA